MLFVGGRNFRRCFSRSCNVFSAPKKHMKELITATGQTNVDRAFQHFDDLYGSVYGNKWPSMRLGLQCPQKYIAVPNSFSDVEHICSRLDSFGAFDLRAFWNRKTETRKNEIVSNESSSHLEDVDKTLEAMARTKVAEEMDTLYQNAPVGKTPGPSLSKIGGEHRFIQHVQDAATALIAPTKLKGTEGFEFESEYFASYSQDQTPSVTEFTFTTLQDAPKLKFPYVRPYTFEGGCVSSFPPASRNKHTELRDWICINAASFVPIMALDLTPGVNMLDLCAGPGTKSLLALMTLCPATLTANDVEASRLGRVKRLFQEFIGSTNPENVHMTRENAVSYPSSSDFDRVLADVPCSLDRISATVSESSIFNPRRLKERLGLIKTQKAILLSGLRALSKSPGSVCVYSTCTLSPLENDGVVGAALRETDEHDLVVDIEGLWETLLPLQALNLLVISRTKFGVLIEPNVFANSGPMFVSRILRRPSFVPEPHAE